MEAAMGSRFVDSILVFLFEFRTNSKQVSCYSHQFQAGFMLFFNLHKTNTKFSPSFPQLSQNLGRPENGETVQKV